MQSSSLFETTGWVKCLSLLFNTELTCCIVYRWMRSQFNCLTNFFDNSKYFVVGAQAGSLKKIYHWTLKFGKPNHWLAVPLHRLQKNLLVFDTAFWVSKICRTISFSNTVFWQSSILPHKIKSSHPIIVSNLIDLFSTDHLCQWSFETFQSLKQTTV